MAPIKVDHFIDVGITTIVIFLLGKMSMLLFYIRKKYKYEFILVMQQQTMVEVVNDKVGIINQTVLVNDEIQIMMKMVNNVNVAFVKRQVIHVEIVHH
jgi:hypothetical protein